ncbi:hypothetical protein HN935_00565 [archaeon]|nr:hypothetical protein [archaeon]
MKKIGCIFILMLVFASSFVLAGITISEPLDVYNLGDRLYVSAEGLVGAESGNLNVDLICGNRTINLEKMSARRYSPGEAFPYSLPYKFLNKEDLEIDWLSDIVGECQVRLVLGANEALTKAFSVSSDVSVVASLDKTTYNPGEAVTVSIEATKANGVLLNGFVESSNGTSFSKAVEEGFVSEIFSVGETAEAGTYSLSIRAYDTAGGGILNEGTGSVSYVVNQVASSIILSLSNEVATPGENFSVGAEIFDQSGKAMEGSVSLKIISPENVETEISVQAGEFGEFDFAFNSSVGTWKIASSFNDMAVEREFEMLGVQKVDLGFEDSILTVTNIGNVVYNKTLDIQIGEETLNLDLNIDIGEIRKFNINAPSGAYDVVINDGDSSISRRVLLTGNAISVESLKEVGIFKGYSIVWIFLIIVLGGVGTVLFMRYRKTRTLGKDGVVKKMVGKVRDKVPGKVKSSVGDSMNFTKKSPAVQGLDDKNYSHEDKTMVDLTKNKVGIAESTLVLKGEKYVSAVVSLSVKNFGELGEAAKSALHGAVNSAQKKKGLVDWRGDYVFIVFSPLVTKTYKNEALAAKVGMEILDELNAYNKKFKDKITFNLGVHVGELIASKTGGKLKYTSIGNTISLAKRISDSASGKLIVSDPIRKKLIRDLKVTKAKEIGENQTFEVSAIKDRSGDKARLDDLLKRQK